MRTFKKIAFTAVAATIALTVPATAASAASPFADMGLGSLGSLGSIFPQPPVEPEVPAEACETVGESTGTPTVTAEKLTCLTAAGQSITVSGEGFSGANFGVYVGLVQDNLYSDSNADAWLGTKWVKAADMTGGKWTATFDVQAVFGEGELAADCLVNTCSIYTMGAHGIKDATQETKTPVSFK